jgi:hypothetical protein
MVTIAYFSLDEVNLWEVAHLAQEAGARLWPLGPRDPEPNGEVQGVLYDLDSLPAERREAMLTALLSAEVRRPTGVHCYNLSETDIRTLIRNGVAVAHQPSEGLLRQLVPAEALRVNSP